MKTPYYFIIAFMLAFVISQCKTETLTNEEQQLVFSGKANETMRLFVIDNYSDSLLLRQKARPINKKNVGDSQIAYLKSRMLATVNDTLDPGVGIAAPQVGVSLQMIYVQRFDKEGEPFEIYFNPVIEMLGDSVNSGMEGCLSVPGYRGKVDRSQNIKIAYIDSTGKPRKETINEFTAVIFQHEIDHLNGVLYYDHVFNGLNNLQIIE